MGIQVLLNIVVIALGTVLAFDSWKKRAKQPLLSAYIASQAWFIWTVCVLFSCIMVLGIEEVLLGCVLLSAVVYGLEKLWWAKRRPEDQKPCAFVFQVCDFFPLLLLVWCVRSFVTQPYRVPTGSLEPTVLPGDFLLVNQYAYGLRLPVLRTKIWPVALPKRGDIAVFFPPNHPNIHYVKRVIGLPGDRITYQNKTLYINGKKMAQTTLGPSKTVDPGAPVIKKQEQLGAVTHAIFVVPHGGIRMHRTWVVPAHHYFMMGDNRDFSSDSRFFGFVPEQNLVGRAMFIWLSWNHQAWQDHDFKHLIRWHRMGHWVSP